MQNEHRIVLNQKTPKCFLGPNWFILLISFLNSPDVDYVDSELVGVQWEREGSKQELTNSVHLYLVFFQAVLVGAKVVPGKFQECIINSLSRASPWLSERVNLKCIDLTCSYYSVFYMASHELAGYECVESWRGMELSSKTLTEENK